MQDRPERIFLGYHRPPLRPAAEWLLERWTSRGTADLGRVRVCVHTARAGQQLLDQLGSACADRRLALTPPAVETVDEAGSPGEHTDAAGPAARLCAWCGALEQAGPDVERALAPGRAGGAVGALGERDRLHLAVLLEATRAELLARGLSIEGASEMLAAAGESAGSERWSAGAAVERIYKARLPGATRAATPAETRTRAAADGARGWTRVLVGVPEIPPALRTVLDRSPPEAVLIIADAEEADRFDGLGAVRPGSFAVTPLRDEQIRAVASPSDQGAAAAEVVARAPRGGECVVGVPDDAVAPFVHVALADRGLRGRAAQGVALAQTPPARFLKALAGFLAFGHTDDLCALVRHPDVFDAIRRRVTGADASSRGGRSWLRGLDEALGERVPGRLGEDWARSGLGHDGAAAGALAALGEVLGTGLHDNRPRPLHEAVGALRLCLAGLYGLHPRERTGAPGDQAGRAAAALDSLLADLGSSGGAPGAGVLTPSGAIELVLSLAEGQRLYAPPEPGAVDLVGWAECVFDSAQTCVVTGMNEGSVPTPSRGAGLLDGASRRGLGVDDGADALARDAYLLGVLMRCHEHVTLISGRSSPAGDPLLPSRLLFTCTDAHLARRVGLWTAQERGPLAADAGRPARASAFVPMPRASFTPPASLPVTAFGAYLRSPYGFFLERVLRLDDAGAPARELTAAVTGDVFHAAMKRFANGPARDALDAGTIEAAMVECVDAELRARFGATHPAAVRVQAAQLRGRIRGVAECMAARRADGWRTLHAEWSPREPVRIQTPRGPVAVTGSIDLVERRAEDGALAILDYKTSETGRTPEQAHGKPGSWRDLQLPLYLHLAAELWRGSAEQPAVELGYINVPVRPGPAEVCLAQWTPDDIASALAEAARVAGRVLGGEFFELGERPPSSGTFGLLCGQGFITDGDLAGEDSPGGDE